jgi:uncharacterized protein (TIGR02594 family)
MNLPKQYQWLELEPGPKMLLVALELYGTKEIVGKDDNPMILSWAKELGLDSIFRADETAWCGLFVGICAKRSGWDVVKDPLWALNWGNFGQQVPEPMLGDILTFKRPGGGHVGIYIGEDGKCYHVLGGNQGNAVSITRIEKVRLQKAARPIWKISQPTNVRKIVVSSAGVISTNEA